MGKSKIEFKLKEKETGKIQILKFEVSKNPLRMFARLTKITRKLKKMDKTHFLVGIESDNKMIEGMLKSEIKTQKVSVEKTGEPDMHGIPDISLNAIKKKFKRKQKLK